MSEEGAVDAPRRLIAPAELVPAPEDGTEAPAPPAADEPSPEPPAEYRVGLDGGRELWIGGELPSTRPLVRFTSAVAAGWRTLWGIGRKPPPGAVALATDPETARRLHHLFRAGLPVLVAGPGTGAPAAGPAVAGCGDESPGRLGHSRRAGAGDGGQRGGGLGNFLRFTAQAAQSGGGAFLIPYLISFLLMGIPLLWIEWAIGRHGGAFGHHSPPGQFDRLGRGRWLKYVGAMGLFTSVGVAAYYCYIESWTLAYVWHSIIGTFEVAPPEELFADYLGQTAGSMFALPVEAVGFFLSPWRSTSGSFRAGSSAASSGRPSS